MPFFDDDDSLIEIMLKVVMLGLLLILCIAAWPITILVLLIAGPIWYYEHNF